MKLRSIAWLAAVSITVWTGCSEDDPPSDDPCDTFDTTLKVLDAMTQPASTFNAGEDVLFNLEIANTTNAPATLTAGSTCTAVVFEVFDANKQRLWGSADTIVCIQMLQPRTYLPYEKVQHNATWQPPQFNPPRPPTTYSVTATVGQFMTDSQGRQHECRAALSKSAEFTLQ